MKKEIFYISISCLSFILISKYIYDKYNKKNNKLKKQSELNKEIINFIDSEDDYSYYSITEMSSDILTELSNNNNYDSNYDSNYDCDYESDYDSNYHGDCESNYENYY
jgi:hypothetical protein